MGLEIGRVLFIYRDLLGTAGTELSGHAYRSKLAKVLEMVERNKRSEHFQKSSLEILDYLSRNSIYPGNFPFGQTRKYSIYSLTEISGI